MVLRSLPESFSTLTTALESRSDDELTFDLVKSKVVDEVAKRCSSGGAESVLKSHVKPKKFLCHHCQKPGHKQKECPSLADKRTSERKPSEDQRDKRNQPRVRAARQESKKKQEYSFGSGIRTVQKHLAEQFKITCLGDVKHYLGIKVTRSGGQSDRLNQQAYIEKVAERFGQSNAKRSPIPMDPGYPNAQQKEEEPMPRNDEF